MARVTIVDVAKAAGVSTSTASVALRGEAGVSEATRERVVATAAELGYRVDHRARLLRESRSRAVGVTFRPAQAFHADVVEALYEAASERGVDLVLSAITATRGPDAAVEALLRDRCSALVLISPEVDEAALTGWAAQVPVVVLGSPLRAAGVGVVSTDEAAGMALAVDHLVALGHRDILHVDGADGVMAVTRAEAYRDAMHRHGLTPRVAHGGVTEEAGIAAAERLLEHDSAARPTAVVAYNDMAAIGLLLTLRAAGVAVPGDIAVVGYDDTRTARLSTIGLTSVSQDPRALAAATLAALENATHAASDSPNTSPGRNASDTAEDPGGQKPTEQTAVTTHPRLAIRSTTVR
ncbi:LacI family DNA-binding transcriptional regulator [Mobilicoccus massiliensis]|uniref:LacI family DNA-binding transcriptional regulator n=1 Tax=Mobilicoccus massiliensis TaxID=1522310 RepID=UPI0006945DC7|nr:LacI family DNA-binding transcriptional regulator [Mobilicoccus massiliensis]